MLFCILWATGFAQTLSFKIGTRFRRTDLDVHWEVPSNAIPAHAKIYKLLPNRFTKEGIAGLIAAGGFTEKEKTKDETNWLVYNTPNDTKRLGVLYPLGSIEYEIRETHSATNLVEALPSQTEVAHSLTHWLAKLGIKMGEIERRENSTEPNLHFFDSETEYYVKNAVITNIDFRGVRFRRAVDSFPVIANGIGGDCEFRYGDHGKLVKISMSWRTLKEHKDAATASPDKIMNWIRAGRAVQNMIPMDAEPINWKTVKSLTVNNAKLCYYGGIPSEPSDWLIPFVALWTTVDRGHGTINVEIDCPILDK